MISHCFVKIAASDDGNFILPPHEAEAREGGKGRGGERERQRYGEDKEGEKDEEGEKVGRSERGKGCRESKAKEGD